MRRNNNFDHWWFCSCKVEESPPPLLHPLTKMEARRVLASACMPALKP